MFKQLFSALKSGDALDRAFSQFEEMLDHAQWMFLRANEVLHRKTTAADVKDSIYARDKSINDLLRSIRRKLVRHLTINPGSDVAACLALMSVAKDAERIGDYCKNVFEVGQFYKEDSFHVARYNDPLAAVCGRVAGLFDTVRTSFRESDSQQAKSALKIADELGANSLAYLSMEGVYEAIGTPATEHCDACFTGEYPLGDPAGANGKFALEQAAVPSGR